MAWRRSKDTAIREALSLKDACAELTHPGFPGSVGVLSRVIPSVPVFRRGYTWPCAFFVTLPIASESSRQSRFLVAADNPPRLIPLAGIQNN